MRPIFIIALLSFCTRVAAQTNPEPFKGERMIYTQIYAQKVERYKKVSIAGIIMAVAGGIMLPVGISKYEDGRRGGACFCSAPPSRGPQPSASAQESLEQGILLTIAGTAFTATGITLASIGFSKQKSYQRRIDLGIDLPEIYQKGKEGLKLKESEIYQKRKDSLGLNESGNDQKRIEGLGLNELEKYQRRKVVGIVMSVAGGILFSVGYIDDLNHGAPRNSSLVLGGGALLGTGIPLFISGVKNEKRYHRRVDGLTLNLQVSPQQSGLMLAYKF